MKKHIKTNQAVLYNGDVHIRYMCGKTIKYINKHNNATDQLFTAITLALGGRFEDAKAYMPKYLMAKGLEGDEPINCFYTRVLVQDKKYYKGTELTNGLENDKIRYAFMVPVSNLITGKMITKLQLINEKNDVCAEIDLDETNQISTDLAASLLIYWDLKFADSGTTVSD